MPDDTPPQDANLNPPTGSRKVPDQSQQFPVGKVTVFMYDSEGRMISQSGYDAEGDVETPFVVDR